MPPATPSAVAAPPVYTSTVHGPVCRPPPDPNEQQVLLDYSADLNHTNNVTVIERLWASNMDVVCD